MSNRLILLYVVNMRGLILIGGGAKIAGPEVNRGSSQREGRVFERRWNKKTGYFDGKRRHSVNVIELFYAEEDAECEPVSLT